MRRTIVLASLFAAVLAAPAGATPVCTDGYMGGPPSVVCGGRIFPEAAGTLAYVQYLANPAGFKEYQHGVEHMARKYSRWVSTTTLAELYKDPKAKSAGPDAIRPYEAGDAGDGLDIPVIKITDHQVPDAGKRTLLFSLSVHGNERGGLEGGLRAAEDLAIAATGGGTISDGVDNYASTTGRKPVFHSYEVRELLAKQAVYLVDFNVDGWAVGDLWAVPPLPYSRGNTKGTDINRQMPSVGRIDVDRNPLQESEALYGHRLMHDTAAKGRGGLLDYGADIHGELNSQAYVDIMYPAGQFDSVDHRRLMGIAERTKSIIDATLFDGIIDEIEEATGGNEAEAAQPAIPTKPAHWATVWDTLGYTDTGFIGDYLATDLGVTGMDYEIFLNHSVPDKLWTVYLQENHINASRAIIKTSMAYSMFADEEFKDGNVVVDPKGRAGYVVNPDTVSDRDANGAGTLPGPAKNGVGADGKPVEQRSYEVTNQQWFRDTDRLMPKPFVKLAAADIAAKPEWLDYVDTLVLADEPAPGDAKGRSYDRTPYFANMRAWVERGGNLVLTDRALHALGNLGVVAPDAVRDIRVYQPYANVADLGHPLTAGLRGNARQLVEAPVLGYEIGNDASPMTIVSTSAWEGAQGHVVATTGNAAGDADDGTQTSIGELALGKGKIRIVGGALPTPTEANDHRYGLRDYAMTYTGLFTMENSIVHDVPGLGEKELPPDAVTKAPGAACLKGRSFIVRVPKRVRGSKVRSARVEVGGKRVKTRRSKTGRRIATVSLTRQRGRPLTVKIVMRNAKGRRVTVVKRYKVCPAAKKKAKPKAE
jgi:hypothetical protein